MTDTPETLAARLARLEAEEIPLIFFWELETAWKSGNLIALATPATGEPARIWTEKADPFDNLGLWSESLAHIGDRSAEYIALSALSAEFSRRERAARVQGMRDAAGVLGRMLLRGTLQSFWTNALAAIRAAADKLEAGK